MAMNYYSNQQVQLEAVFEDYSTTCICSRVQLRDSTKKIDLEENDFETSNPCHQSKESKHSTEDMEVNEQPYFPFEGEYEQDSELMKSMGLPVNFGKKVYSKKTKSDKVYDNLCDNSETYEYDYYEEKYNNYYDENYDYFQESQDVRTSDNEDDVMFKESEYVRSSDYDDHTMLRDSNSYSSEVIEGWKQYWEQHGESILMNSWVQKYKEYVQPEYLDQYNLASSETISDTNALPNVNEIEEKLENVELMDSNCTSSIGGTDTNIPVLKEDYRATNDEAPNEIESDVALKDMDPELVDTAKDYANKYGNNDYYNDLVEMASQNHHSRNNMFVIKTPLKSSECPADIKEETWDDLWMRHRQEMYDHHFKLYSESFSPPFNESDSSTSTSTDIEENEGCTVCKRKNCYLCSSKNMDESTLLQDLNFVYLPDLPNTVPQSQDICLKEKDNVSENGILQEIANFSESSLLPAGDTMPDSQVTTEMVASDDEPPTELPIAIKRNHSSDAEECDDTPTDDIKSLGLVIKPTDLRIKQKIKRRKTKRTSKRKCPFQMLNTPINTKDAENSSEISTSSVQITNDLQDISKDVSEEVIGSVENPVCMKYWSQRYRLFSLFDRGIKLDTESWFSVTPERIASHVAERCSCDVIVDAFCGAGGNSIQFAFTCYHVIAIDIDPIKISMAKNNARVYGVDKHIDFIVGDFFSVAPKLKADAVFLSPPWGGPKYLESSEYDLKQIEPDIYKTFEVARRISNNIALFVPRNTIVNQLVQLAGHGNRMEIEQNVLNKKVKTITAYFGDLVEQDSEQSHMIE